MTDSQGFGEIPERPVDPQIQRVAIPQGAPGYSHIPLSQEPASTGPTPQDARTYPFPDQLRPSRRKTRAQIQELRRQEREEGVDFPLPNTGIDARVRDLPLTDRIMLRGIPADMRKQIEKAIEVTTSFAEQEEGNIANALSLIDAEAALSDASCLVGFILPRLARTEAERVQIMHQTGLGEDDVLLLEELHPDEKAAYRDWIFRDRDGSQEDVARLATFPGAGVAEVPGSEDRPGEEGGPLSDPDDGGVGLRAGGALSA